MVRVPATQNWAGILQSYQWPNGDIPNDVKVWAYSAPGSVVTFTAGQLLNTAILTASDIQNFLAAGIITQTS